jgi:outer membrane protein assembly factor BamB
MGVVVEAERFGIWGNRNLGTVLHWSKGQVDDRVLLVLTWPHESRYDSGSHAYLMNRDGTIYHEWKFDRSIMHARFLENGNLLAMFFTQAEKRISGNRGECDEVAEFSWTGKKLWSYSKPLLHHDIIPMEGESVAILQNEPLSEKDKSLYAPDAVGTAFGDSVVIVKKSDGEVTWRWSLLDVMPEFKDRILDTRDPEIGHFNSIQYLAKNPWNGKPAFLVSSRELSTVFAIEIETKKLLWSSPRGLFSVQHDAQLLDGKGGILVFDNGVHPTHVATRVVRLNPLNNQILWQWTDPFNFFAAPMMGGAQQQPNGNILITNSHIGQIFEITPDGRIVWNFLGAFESDPLRLQSSWWPGTRLYRVHSYPRPNF